MQLIKKVLSEIQNKLNKINADYIPDTGYLMKYMLENKYSIFPQYKTVEKPDKVVSDILQGKAVIFINGCAYGVVIPVVFVEFFKPLKIILTILLLQTSIEFLDF